MAESEITLAVSTQILLRQAEEQLSALLDGQSLDENPRLQVLRAIIISVRVYSASSNSIPGYRGLGLDEALEISREIIEFSPRSDKDLSIHSYGPAIRQFTISKPTPPSNKQ